MLNIPNQEKHDEVIKLCLHGFIGALASILLCLTLLEFNGGDILLLGVIPGEVFLVWGLMGFGWINFLKTTISKRLANYRSEMQPPRLILGFKVFTLILLIFSIGYLKARSMRTFVHERVGNHGIAVHKLTYGPDAMDPDYFVWDRLPLLFYVPYLPMSKCELAWWFVVDPPVEDGTNEKEEWLRGG